MPHMAQMQAPQMARPDEYCSGVAKRSILPTPARDVVASNLAALGIGGRDPHRVRYRDIGSVSASQVRRINEKLSGATIDALYEIAAHFGLQAWHLLHPMMDGRKEVNIASPDAAESGTIAFGDEVQQEATATVGDGELQIENWHVEAERFRNYFLTLSTSDRRRYLKELRELAERTEREQVEAERRARGNNVSTLRGNNKK